MSTLVGSFLLMTIIVLIMSVGVILGRKPVSGSCGGLNQIDGLGSCDICGNERNKCESVTKAGVS